MAPDSSTSDLANWLAGEIAAVEAELQGQGPTCMLDRRRASPPSLKYSEGRYAALRRARQLIAQGKGLEVMRGEADKARSFLAGGGVLSADRQWQAYQQGLLAAAEAVLEQVGEPGQPDARADR